MAREAHQLARRPKLSELVVTAIRAQVFSGALSAGEKLPTESQMTAAFGVSRTVVREAVAALRAEGLVEPRQGAGVFVLQPAPAVVEPFKDIDFDRVSSVIEVLELRTAVEVEAAGLAALRRSPQQEERIIDAYREVHRLSAAGEPTTDADFALHLAIADAANNPRFREFLSMIGPSVIPRRALSAEGAEAASGEYLSMIDREHERIVAAILGGEEDEARSAMRAHLHGSQSRYRTLLRQSFGGG
jgi:DNA-binding FadR family transcriptional regulator